MKKFEECKANDHKTLNRWYDECTKLNQPYVYVHPKVKYAKVGWDFITLPPGWEDLLQEDAQAIFDEIAFVISEYTSQAQRINPLVGSFDKLSHENARKVADSIFDILNARLPSVVA